jgi:hypothetical protein
MLRGSMHITSLSARVPRRVPASAGSRPVGSSSSYVLRLPQGVRYASPQSAMLYDTFHVLSQLTEPK